MFAAFSSSFITTPGITRRIQLTLSLYGRTWIRWNSSRRCSPRIEAYRMFVSTPRMMSSYSARRRAIAVSPIGSTKPAHRRAEFSQSRYSGESSRIFTWYDVAVPWISTSGYSSFAPPVPIDATVSRSTRPLIAPRASCNAGNSAICPFSRSSRKLTLRLREEPVHHPLGLEPADVLVRLSEVDEHDRLSDRLGHRERGPSLRVRVDLREDDSVDADGFVKLLRLLDGVVSRERVVGRRLGGAVHAGRRDAEGWLGRFGGGDGVEGVPGGGRCDRVAEGRLDGRPEGGGPGAALALGGLREAVRDRLGGGGGRVG